MGKLLLDSEPLIVIPELAEKIGLNESIILQQIHYWLEINRKANKNLNDGYYWTYNTYEGWRDQFKFWSESTIKRAILRLQKLNLIIIGNYNKLKIDKTKWYRVNYEEVAKLEGVHTTGQNDPSSVSNWSVEEVDMTQPLPETTTETTTETNNNIVDDKHQRICKKGKIDDSLIENIWSLYPRKQGKSDAVKKIPKLIDKYGYDQIIRCVERYKDYTSSNRIEMKYIKHGSTFFNGTYQDYLDDNFNIGVEAIAPTANNWRF